MVVLPEIPLWPHVVPGALGSSECDIPTITPFFPDATKASGAAMVVCPGGGYGMLADHEGSGYASWLVDQGITALVLKYRLGSDGYRHPTMLNDVTRAMRLSRHLAPRWNVDPKRIGIIGSSAGGHLASTLITHYDSGDPTHTDPVERCNSRPDVGILCYGVLTMGEHTHLGSKTNLLGDTPSQDLVEYLSSERQVSKDTPPCFIWHTWEDPVVKVENALAFARALRKVGVRFELHIYELGHHGIGIGGETQHRWINDCNAWLKERGFSA